MVSLFSRSLLVLSLSVGLIGCGEDSADSQASETPSTEDTNNESKGSGGVAILSQPGSNGTPLEAQDVPNATDGDGSDGDSVAVD